MAATKIHTELNKTQPTYTKQGQKQLAIFIAKRMVAIGTSTFDVLNKASSCDGNKTTQ